MLTKAYRWFHRLASSPSERGEYSSGYLQERVRNEAFKLFNRMNSGRAIDIGCGEGLFLAQLSARNSGLEIWGIDNDSERLKRAEERLKSKNIKNIHLSLQEAAKTEFNEAFFDVAICINVFFNLPSVHYVRDALREMVRICKKSGRIIFDFRNSANPLLGIKYKLAPYYDDTVKNLPLNTYSHEEIEKILEDLNLTIVRRRIIGFPIARFAPVVILEAKKAC